MENQFRMPASFTFSKNLYHNIPAQLKFVVPLSTRCYFFFTNTRHATLHSTCQHDLRVRSIHLHRIDMFALFQVCVAGCGIAR